MKKSLVANATLNMIRTILGIIFPLITFPYISRVLGVTNIGKINFASSIVSYFSLIGAFGVANYAIREGARVRDKKEEFQNISNEMFSINIVTTIIAYTLLIVMMFISRTLRNYSLLIAIQSAAIFFTTIGTDWINSIYEDFLYITIRQVLVQLCCLIMMFVFVHTPKDYYLYAAISVFSSVGANICNFFYCKRYVKLRFVFTSSLKRHIPSMLMFFLSNLTTTIFLNSDQTMLGIICGDYNVGLYSVSVKIYTIMKSFFTAILTVLMPRMIYMLSNSDSISIQKFEQKVVLIYTSLVFPLATGLFVLSDSAILIVGGENYMGAVPSLQILSVSLLCSAMAYFLTCVVIIPRNKEKIMMSASATSAVANVILNLFFIKFLSESGAAITTAISEIIVFIIEYVGGKKNIFASHMFRHFLNIIIGCFCIVGVKYIVRLFIPNIIISAIIIIPVSIIVYLLALIICKDETIKIAIDFIRKRN